MYFITFLYQSDGIGIYCWKSRSWFGTCTQISRGKTGYWDAIVFICSVAFYTLAIHVVILVYNIVNTSIE